MIQNSFDYQRLYYLLFSIFTIYINDINSKTSTHWFLNEIKEQIVPGFIRCNNENDENVHYSEKGIHNSLSCSKCCNKHSININSKFKMSDFDSDIDNYGYNIMQILNGNIHVYYENGTWEIKYALGEAVQDPVDQNLDILLIWGDQNNNTLSDRTSFEQIPDSREVIKENFHKITAKPTSMNTSPQSYSKPQLPVIQTNDHLLSSNFGRPSQSLISCYPYVNLTQYDHLNGIYYRDTYKYYPEPEVALIFTKKTKKNLNIKVILESVEEQLTKAKAKKPNSPNVYNNIGNLLRVHGQSREAVECFRCALRLSPHHSDVLLNLARVLYNQNYLEDAIYLTRHSLETQPRNRNPWLQHFTLGEILRSTGHKQEAQFHFLHVLELNPGFRPAKDYLQELSSKASPITTVYSFCITIFLLSLVFYALFLNVEFNDADNENQKPQRHFNRGMAMKALRTLNSKPRLRRNV